MYILVIHLGDETRKGWASVDALDFQTSTWISILIYICGVQVIVISKTTAIVIYICDVPESVILTIVMILTLTLICICVVQVTVISKMTSDYLVVGVSW